MSKKKVVGYVRVSTLEQVDNTSLTDQEKKINMYCELHDYELVSIYKDEGESGSKVEARESYNNMIEYVTDKSNGVSAVVVLKIDRIHRSGKNLLIMVEDKLDPVGVNFVSITEQFDTSTPMGKLFLSMLGSFAEFERATINARTKGGRLETAKAHAYAGGSIAFGYRLADKEKFVLEVVEEEAAVVKEIFTMRAEGKSLEKIAKALVGKGIFNKGKIWNKQAISYILHNETYLGNYSYHGKKEQNGINYQVPKIVSKQLWNKCK